MKHVSVEELIRFEWYSLNLHHLTLFLCNGLMAPDWSISATNCSNVPITVVGGNARKFSFSSADFLNIWLEFALHLVGNGAEVNVKNYELAYHQVCIDQFVNYFSATSC